MLGRLKKVLQLRRGFPLKVSDNVPYTPTTGTTAVPVGYPVQQISGTIILVPASHDTLEDVYTVFCDWSKDEPEVYYLEPAYPLQFVKLTGLEVWNKTSCSPGPEEVARAPPL